MRFSFFLDAWNYAHQRFKWDYDTFRSHLQKEGIDGYYLGV